MLRTVRLLFFLAGSALAEDAPFQIPAGFPEPTLPADNEPTPERVALGSDLFSDSRLSIDGSMSCVACHDPELAFGDDRRISRGFNNTFGTRHSMPLFNLAWKSSFFWDGRAESLRAQVLDPIQSRHEMAANLNHVLRRLNRNKDYSERFAKAYGEGAITSEKLGKALEAFLLTLISADSPRDQAKRGDREASALEKRGEQIFNTDAPAGGSCYQCHGGETFTDHQFRSNGLEPSRDRGRETATGEEADRYKFITPSLRNVAITQPYMHDGRFESLREVLDHYDAAFHPESNLAPELKPFAKTGLSLTDEDKTALIAFLESLTDPQYSE